MQTHGAKFLGNNQTRFSLWAPDAQSVGVEFDNGEYHPLSSTDAGWFSRTLNVGPGTLYRFVINDELRVPDPASRFQPQGVHGYSQVVDQDTYRWLHPDWKGRAWHEAVIYELHCGLFGGFSGVCAHFSRLRLLGITAVQLMPVAQFPGARNWGYDGVQLFAPQNSYGSPDDLKRLIDAAHSHGLMVYLDVVYNHFGPEGNYLSHYAGDFFKHDEQTPWGNAINFQQPEVVDFFYENALMWIQEYRFDGLRLDAVHAIPEQEFLIGLARRIRSAVDPARHVHLVLENEKNNVVLLESGFNAQWNDDGHNILHAILTGEHDSYYRDYSTQSTEKLARCLCEGFVFQGEKTTGGKARGEPSAHLPPTSFVLFLQNHDQTGNRLFGERLTLLADEHSLKAAVALMLLCPMVPLLFMGEERGSTQPFLYFTDHPEPLAEAVRLGRQKEFPPSSSQRGGKQQIPDPNHLDTFLSSLPFSSPEASNPEELTRDAEWLDYYTHLIRLRHQHITPRLSGSQALATDVIGHAAVSVEWLMADGSVLLIAINLGGSSQTASRLRDSELKGQSHVIFSHRADAASGQLNPGSIAVSLTPARRRESGHG